MSGVRTLLTVLTVLLVAISFVAPAPDPPAVLSFDRILLVFAIAVCQVFVMLRRASRIVVRILVRTPVFDSSKGPPVRVTFVAVALPLLC